MPNNYNLWCSYTCYIILSLSAEIVEICMQWCKAKILVTTTDYCWGLLTGCMWGKSSVKLFYYVIHEIIFLIFFFNYAITIFNWVFTISLLIIVVVIFLSSQYYFHTPLTAKWLTNWTNTLTVTLKNGTRRFCYWWWPVHQEYLTLYRSHRTCS